MTDEEYRIQAQMIAQEITETRRKLRSLQFEARGLRQALKAWYYKYEQLATYDIFENNQEPMN